jgi:NADPH:quinone reductase-like Zn-dependent oxidoreductase
MRSMGSELEELTEHEQARDAAELEEERPPAEPDGSTRPEGAWRVYSVGFRKPFEVELFHYDEGELPDGQFRIRTLFAGISAGTELTHFTGTNPYMNARWDDDLKLFMQDGHSEYPMMFTGYMQVGRVVASRTDAAREGQVVGMTYGHKSGHTCDLMREVFFPLPDDLEPILGIYAAQMGPICANGILHADEEELGAAVPWLGAGLRDKNVVVLGTGVIGMLTGMMALDAGAREVAIVGRNPHRLGIAAELGMIPVNNRETDPGEWAKGRWKTDWLDRGADFAFQCSGSDELLHHAFRCLRPQCAVVDLGFYQGGSPNLSLGHEFHHNGLRHLCAQIFRVPKRLRGAWDRGRLAAETIRFLQRQGDAVREHLITDVIPYSQAQRAYDLLAGPSPRAMQVVLDCGR